MTDVKEEAAPAAETAEEVKKDAKKVEVDPNKVVLLGSISYSDEFQYEEWLKTMDLNQSVFVLVAAANYAQSKGLLSIAESELVAGALRTIKKNSKTTPPLTKDDVVTASEVVDKK